MIIVMIVFGKWIKVILFSLVVLVGVIVLFFLFFFLFEGFIVKLLIIGNFLLNKVIEKIGIILEVMFMFYILFLSGIGIVVFILLVFSIVLLGLIDLLLILVVMDNVIGICYKSNKELVG